jgi:SAM-dependent methyltransferase
LPRLNGIDQGRAFDWGRTSADYAAHRPGPPPSFYERLRAEGVGLPGQRILDLGTGTGLLALQLARQGSAVVGIDIAPEQIATAQQSAATEKLDARFGVASAEATALPAASFDAITALQCWFYFDAPRAIAEVKRLLAPGAVLVVAYFNWLPRIDAIARGSEKLVLQFNPDWNGGDWSGEVPASPRWAARDFDVAAWFSYDAAIPFTRDSWRGRIRACRGTGAALSASELERFDEAHDRLLRKIAADSFTIQHRLSAHILEPRPHTT